MNKIKRTLGFIIASPLSRRHPVKSIFRFLVWQSQSRLLPSKFFVKDFVTPVKFYAKKGLTGITGNIYAGLHEFNDMGFLLHFLRAGDVFFDIGANVGSFTLLAAGVSKAQTITIEPVKATFDILNKNITLNSMQNKVTTLNMAIGAKKGVAIFTSSEDTTNHVATEEEYDNNDIIRVPMITVDSLIADGVPALIKIDVEGYETEALTGMKNTLSSPTLKAIILELNGSGSRYGYDEEDIHKNLLANGFKPFSYDPLKRILTKMNSFSQDHLNTIYCRDEDFVNQRIKQAPRINIMGELL